MLWGELGQLSLPGRDAFANPETIRAYTKYFKPDVGVHVVLRIKKIINVSVRPLHHSLHFLQVKYGRKCLNNLKIYGEAEVKLHFFFNLGIR